MSQKRHNVRLKKWERQQLQKIVQYGQNKARKITRCRILLLADGANGKTDEEIAAALNVCLATVSNVRRRCCQEGMERAINENARSGQPAKFIGKVAARITAIACSAPPDGYAKWTLSLLADRIVELKVVESISPPSVSSVLKKTTLSHI